MKKTKKLSALILAMLMLFMISMPAMAADATPITSINMTKILDVEEGIHTPNDTFTFNVVNSTDITTVPTVSENYSGSVMYSGVTGGLAAPANVTSTAAAETGGSTQTLAVDASVFERPGIYRYEVSENPGALHGMTYDDTVYYVDLFVEYNSNNELQVSTVIVSKVQTEGSATTAEKASALTFDNLFETSSAGGELHNVVVEKSVTGNQGDRTADFTFTVSYATEGNRVLEYRKGSTGNWTDITSGTNVTLKHGESFTLKGLAEGDKYTIAETAAAGYTPSITGSGAGYDETKETDGTAGAASTTGEQTMGTADVSINYTNTKSGTIPTGLFTNYKPFWVMGAVGIVLALVFFKKRKNRFADEI